MYGIQHQSLALIGPVILYFLDDCLSLQIFDSHKPYNDNISIPLCCTQPKIVEALLGYELVQVSCGASHVLAVTNEREVFAWGRGDNGKLTN